MAMIAFKPATLVEAPEMKDLENMQTSSPQQGHGEVAPEQVKHTPGPWHFVEENAGLMMDHGYGILYGEADIWGWEKNLYVSVGCSTNVERALGKGAAEANARLIAAAPDMLAALEMMVTWMPSGFAPQSQAEAMTMAYAAIKKALGRNSDDRVRDSDKGGGA